MIKFTKKLDIIQMTNHWGVIEIDFTNHTFNFGDSLNLTPPRNTLTVLRQWLLSVGEKTEMQTNFSRLDVPFQGPGSGSCGVIAVNTIERAVNPAIPKWTNETSAYHRIRYLKLLT